MKAYFEGRVIREGIDKKDIEGWTGSSVMGVDSWSKETERDWRIVSVDGGRIEVVPWRRDSDGKTCPEVRAERAAGREVYNGNQG